MICSPNPIKGRIVDISLKAPVCLGSSHILDVMLMAVSVLGVQYAAEMPHISFGGSYQITHLVIGCVCLCCDRYVACVSTVLLAAPTR